MPGLQPGIFYPQWGVLHYQTGQFYQAINSSIVDARFLIVLCYLVDIDQDVFAGFLYNTYNVL